MTIAIMSALPEEQVGLVQLLGGGEPLVRAGRQFWRCQHRGQAVVCVLSGIGKVAAATTATSLLDHFGAEALLFTGVAGGVGPGVQVGDVVVASHYVQHDMDASPLFPRYEVPGYGQTLFACDARLTEALARAVAQGLQQHGAGWTAALNLPPPHLHEGLVASGDRFVSSAAEVQQLCSGLAGAGLQPLAVEMEGAAIAQVCADYGVPFAAMRSISDRADDSAHLDFPLFVSSIASRYARFVVSAL